MHTRFIQMVLLLVALVLITGTTLAQEATAVPTPTGEVLEPVAGISASVIWPLVAIGGLLLFGLIEAVREYHRSKSSTLAFDKFFDRYDEATKRRDTRDYGERKFTESALSVQDAVLFAKGLLQVLANADLPVVDRPLESTLDYLKSITDGQPNTGPLPPGLTQEKAEPKL